MLFVSLGAWCQVAQQLKTHRPDEFVPSAFDWIVCPLKSVKKIIDTNGDNFCDGLFLSTPQNSIACKGYGILYHHDFPRNEKNEAFIEEGSSDNTKSKMTHKHKSMSSRVRQEGECVTFIRFGGHAEPTVAWPYAKDNAIVDTKDLNDIAESIEKEFPDLAFRIIFVTCPTAHTFKVAESKLDPRIWTVEMPHRPGVDWSGSSDDWAEMIGRVPKSFEKLSANSAREESPFKGIEDDFGLVGLFSKEQIKAINKFVNKKIQSASMSDWNKFLG